MFDDCKHGSDDHTANRDTADANTPAITAENDVPAFCFTVAAYLWFAVIKLNWKACHVVLNCSCSIN
jgi:hypothetical protein